MKRTSLDHRPAVLLIAGILPVLGFGGCSASYFQSLIQSSRVIASVNSPGEISVPALTDQAVTYKNPKVQFGLSARSSPVTLTGVTRMVYAATDTANPIQSLTINTRSGTGTTAILLKQSIVLSGDTASVTAELPAIWSQNFLNTALPTNGRPDADSPRAWFVEVTLDGANQLGQTVTTTVGIPITISQQAG